MIATDLDTGEEVVFSSRAAASPRCSPAPRCPGVFPSSTTTAARLVDGGVVDTVPLWHALAGPVDRDLRAQRVAGDLLDRPQRSPLDVVMTAFAISRKQRFELELRNVPETSR